MNNALSISVGAGGAPQNVSLGDTAASQDGSDSVLGGVTGGGGGGGASWNQSGRPGRDGYGGGGGNTNATGSPGSGGGAQGDTGAGWIAGWAGGKGYTAYIDNTNLQGGGGGGATSAGKPGRSGACGRGGSGWRTPHRFGTPTHVGGGGWGGTSSGAWRWQDEEMNFSGSQPSVAPRASSGAGAGGSSGQIATGKQAGAAGVIWIRARTTVTMTFTNGCTVNSQNNGTADWNGGAVEGYKLLGYPGWQVWRVTAAAVGDTVTPSV